MTAPNNQPAPEGFLRLSSNWLETNPLPEDARLLSPHTGRWIEYLAYRGELIPESHRGFLIATARTDLPREAYADDEIRPMTAEERKALDEFTMKELRSEPGAEVASERAEEKPWHPKVGDWVIAKASYCCGDNGCTEAKPCKECLAMCNRFVIAGEHYGTFFFHPQFCNRDGGCALDETCCEVIVTGDAETRIRLKQKEGRAYHVSEFMPIPDPRDATIATLRAQLDAKNERIHFLEAENRGLNTSVNLAEENRFKVRHELQAKNVENDKLRAEVEHRAKQRDEFQNLFIEASDGFNQRGEQLARLTAELDAVRKERDQFQERCSSEWAVAVERDAAQARCGELENLAIGILRTLDAGCEVLPSDMQRWWAAVNLTPSQQPDNLDSSGGESRTAIAGADGSKHTKGDCNPQGSESRKANPKLASESSASPAVNPSRPEPVKAGELDDLKAFLTEALTDQITQARDWERHYSNDPRGPVDKSFWDGKARAYEECLNLITDAIAPEGKATEGEG